MTHSPLISLFRYAALVQAVPIVAKVAQEKDLEVAPRETATDGAALALYKRNEGDLNTRGACCSILRKPVVDGVTENVAGPLKDGQIEIFRIMGDASRSSAAPMNELSASSSKGESSKQEKPVRSDGLVYASPKPGLTS